MQVKSKSELEEARRGNYQSHNQYIAGCLLHVWLNSGKWTLKNRDSVSKHMIFPEFA